MVGKIFLKYDVPDNYDHQQIAPLLHLHRGLFAYHLYNCKL